jgi:hypothetical protein
VGALGGLGAIASLAAAFVLNLLGLILDRTKALAVIGMVVVVAFVLLTYVAPMIVVACLR